MEDYHKKGGINRMNQLTVEQRQELSKKANSEKVNPTILKATHSGILKIGDQEIECAVLSDGRRVLSARTIYKTMRGKDPRAKERKKSEGAQIPIFLTPNNLKPFLINDISGGAHSLITYKNKNGCQTKGYECSMLTIACDIYLQARDAKVLTIDQEKLAQQCEMIMRGLAKTGLVALIDESTGYFEEKKKDEYRNIFLDYIREEQRKWEKEFPDQFFDMLYKLYNLKKTKRSPSFFGHLIRKYIYTPLANSNGAILEDLESKNPVVYAHGGRQYKMFQFLSDKVGLQALRNHLWQIVGIGNSSDSKEEFERRFKKAFPVISKNSLENHQLDFIAE